MQVVTARCDPDTGVSEIGMNDPNDPNKFKLATFDCDSTLISLEPEHFIPDGAVAYRLIVETPIQ